jgi:hypothetical protein
MIYTKYTFLPVLLSLIWGCVSSTDEPTTRAEKEGYSVTESAVLSCPNFYVEDFNDGMANALTSGVYNVDWCHSFVVGAANTPSCMLPRQTSRTNANDSINNYVGIWVSKSTASCSSVQLTYNWFQFANASAVVEYKQTSDTFASVSSCNASFGWTTAVPSSMMSSLQTCSQTANVNIPFGSSPAVYIKFKSTNSANNAMWWDNIKLTLVGCSC